MSSVSTTNAASTWPPWAASGDPVRDAGESREKKSELARTLGGEHREYARMPGPTKNEGTEPPEHEKIE